MPQKSPQVLLFLTLKERPQKGILSALLIMTLIYNANTENQIHGKK